MKNIVQLVQNLLKPYIDRKDRATQANIAPVETDATSASKAYSVGAQLILSDVLYDVTAPIAQNDALTVGTNIAAADDLETQIASVNSAITNVNTRVDKLVESVCYGFHIDGNESNPSDMVTYLADAVGMTPAKMDYANSKFDYGSWEDAFFMPRPCMLKSDGTVDYYLDPDDYSKKVDGTTASDVSNTSYDGNAMMEWGQNGKKIWLKIVPKDSGKSADVFIANAQLDENYHDWSFHNCDGVSADHFYTPIYNGSVISSKMRSLSGQQVSKTLDGTAEITAAKANNASAKELWNIECVADRFLINMLLILMGKSTDTQTVFGQGANTSGNEAINDTFRTGVHDAKGLFWGTNSGTVSSNNFVNVVKVFGMENYWGFQWRRTNGYILADGTQKVKLTYGKEDGSNVVGYNTDGADYISISDATPIGTSGNYISEMKFAEQGMFGKDTSGTSSTYYCDAQWYNNSGSRFALFGGYSGVGAKVGAFCCVLDYPFSNASWGIDAALSCKPLA